mgnify:CR=1 FL=1
MDAEKMRNRIRELDERNKELRQTRREAWQNFLSVKAEKKKVMAELKQLRRDYRDMMTGGKVVRRAMENDINTAEDDTNAD